jgi:CheY-like chemotaxis protein
MERLVRRLLREDIELVTHFDAGPQPVLVDPHQVEMAVMNLVVNARDAMPRGGKLTLSTSAVELDQLYARYYPGVRPGAYVLLAVTDTGIGMDAATRQRVFEPFFTTKPKGVGTGLGLATVYGIVRQSNGHVCVYSEVGMGAVFRIYFPRAVQPAGHSVELPPPQKRLLGTETVLLVEDDDAVRSLAKAVLQTHGYQVLDAADAAAALKLCESHQGRIHLVLTDLIMPRMSGPQLAQQLEDLRPSVRVLFTSGYTMDTAGQHGMTLPSAHFIQKPYTTEGLIRKIREMLEA